MDRRRGGVRPASTEEIECWSHASVSLVNLSSIYATPLRDTVMRVNRLISAWPRDDVVPTEGFDGVKDLSKKLTSGLDEIVEAADRERKAIDDAMEKLGLVIALRRATEATHLEKRPKRPRSAISPAGTPTPTPAPSRGMSITLPARNSPALSGSAPHHRESKVRRAALSEQLPLALGRKVAYHMKAQGPPGGEDSAEWILAIVHSFIGGDKHRYEVRDADDATQTYRTTLKSILPLPDPEAKPDEASHINAYPKFPAGATVMALYPDTTSFYKATVVRPPKDLNAKGFAHYELKFDDDEDQICAVPPHLVVEYPGN